MIKKFCFATKIGKFSGISKIKVLAWGEERFGCKEIKV